MRQPLIWCSAILGLCLALPSTASTFLAMDSLALVGGSDAVIEGRVLEVESFWSEGGEVIVTEATVLVDDIVLGDAPAVVRVRTFGGTVDDYTVDASGFPRFEKNQRLVLFLHQEKDLTLRVTGYQLGQYQIQEKADGTEIAVPMVDGGMNLLTKDGSKAEAPKAMALGDLKAQILEDARRLQLVTK